MFIEINMMKLDSIFSQAGRIIARRRAQVTDDSYMEPLVDFINTNFDAISPAIGDKDFVKRVENLRSLTIEEFSNLRYVLAEYGFDIQIYAVSDLEKDAEGVPEGMLEYNILDLNDIRGGFIPTCTKFIGSQEDSSMSDLYSKVAEIFDIFKGNLFTGRVNPLEQDIESMKAIESAIGHAPAPLTQHASSILEFIGKRIFVLVN